MRGERPIWVTLLHWEDGVGFQPPEQVRARSLSTRSEEFRIRWAAHNVRFHRTGIKRLHHFIVGDLDLTFEALELPADPGLRITTYTAEPGSPSQEGLNLRASWAATVGRLDRTETAPSTDRA